MIQCRTLVFILSFLLPPLVAAQDVMGVKYVSPAIERGATCWGRETAEKMARQDLVNKASAMCRQLPGKWLLNRKAISSESYGYMQCFPCKSSPNEYSCMIERSRMPCEDLERKRPEKPIDDDAGQKLEPKMDDRYRSTNGGGTKLQNQRDTGKPQTEPKKNFGKSEYLETPSALPPSRLPQSVAVQSSPLGMWLLTYDTGQMLKLSFSTNGAMLESGDDRYPGRWSQQGNHISVQMFGTEVHMRRNEIAVQIELELNGNEMTGVQLPSNVGPASTPQVRLSLKRVGNAGPAATKSEARTERVADASGNRPETSGAANSGSSSGEIKVATYMVFDADRAKANKKSTGYVVGWTSVSAAEIARFKKVPTNSVVGGKVVEATGLTTNEYRGQYESPATNFIIQRFKNAIERHSVANVAASGKSYDGVCVRESHGTQCQSGLIVLNKGISFEDFVKMHRDHIGDNIAFTLFADIGRF